MSDERFALVVDAPGLGIGLYESQPVDDVVIVTARGFSNDGLSLEWDRSGSIVAILDKRENRQVLRSGEAIHLELAPDHPVEHDAWDLESWTAGLGTALVEPTSIEIIEQGPLVAALRVTHSFGQSAATQTFRLRAGSARLDIEIEVDWHEHEQLLSLVVPVDVSSRDAACDIQFGHVMRPPHASTSWDAAKFEVCAHRFVDVSEPAWGVAVLNDGRFGHGLMGDAVRVSLLRAARYPDPHADAGSHRVTISVLPHSAGLDEVRCEAERLNIPLRAATTSGDGPVPQPLLQIDRRTVEVSALKRAHDGSPDLIMRLFESSGSRATVCMTLRDRLLRAQRCNLLEEPHDDVAVEGHEVVLSLRPFELVTLRLTSAHEPADL